MRLHIGWRSKNRPRVLDIQTGVEVETTDHLAGATPSRVVLIAHWMPDTRVTKSVAELVGSLARNDFSVALVSTAEGEGPLVWPGSVPDGVTILRRPNVGYDFGSWAAALDRYPALAAADEVLLMNDSLVGPFTPFDSILARFHSSGADIWGLTDTTQFQHHMQSYCLGFKHQVLCEPPLAAFWRSICVEASRDDVIHRYEIGLGRLLRRESYSLDPVFHYEKVVGEGRNPTIHGWRRLLDLGFPFVKRELLLKPGVTEEGWEVPSEVMRRFGVDVKEWV
jgi:hypothetical protein